jgi:2-hydroxy-3-oxopropionate reductase
MGRPMALNLIEAAYPLAVFARRPEACEPLAEAGATVYESPARLAAQVDVVITMVTDTPDLEDVINGEHGIACGAKPGCVVVDMSTISPKTTLRLAEKLADGDVEMLDAPVSGGEQGAIDGSLSIMVGGKPEVFAGVRPVFECLGKHIVHVGGHGAGQVAKACNQLLVAQTIAAVAEAMLLAHASGIDPAYVREALMGGFAYSRILEVHGQRMLDNNFKPGFKTALHCKDVRIALETAREAQIELPGAARMAACLEELVEGGQGELDSAAIAQAIWGRASLE